MPRLLLTVTTDLTYDQRMQRICHTLAAAGYTVHLVGRRRPRSVALTPATYRQTRLWGRFERGALFYLEYNARLLAWLLRHPVDAICGVDLDTAPAAWCAARLRGIPFVFDAHEHFTEMEEVVRRPLVRRVWRWVEGWVVPRTRHAYTVGPTIARLLEQRHRTPFAVVRNVPPGRPLSAPTPAAVPYLIYVGALNEGRGLEELLHALVELPAHLWVCGEGDRSAQLRQLAHQLGLDERVRFLGYVAPAHLPPLLAGARAGYLMLTHRGLSYYYSLANKFFDYVQAGIPQVTVDFPEYRALNQEHEVALLTNLSVAAVRTAVGQLFADHALHARLSANARRARRVWTWEQESEQLLAVYARVFEDHPPPPRP